jgi:tryptophanyl-tRNA synthetase
VKDRLAEALNHFLEPMRERRSQFEQQGGLVEEIIVDGTERTRREVQQVVFDARSAMGLTGIANRLRRRAERSRAKTGPSGR